jgi:hypothetical protein
MVDDFAIKHLSNLPFIRCRNHKNPNGGVLSWLDEIGDVNFASRERDKPALLAVDENECICPEPLKLQNNGLTCPIFRDQDSSLILTSAYALVELAPNFPFPSFDDSRNSPTSKTAGDAD